MLSVVQLEGTTGPIYLELMRRVQEYLKDEELPEIFQFLVQGNNVTVITDSAVVASRIRNHFFADETLAEGRVMRVNGVETAHWGKRRRDGQPTLYGQGGPDRIDLREGS